MNDLDIKTNFIEAAINNDMSLVSHYVENYWHIIKDDINHAFVNAGCQGHIELCRYFLTSPTLPKHANIHTADDTHSEDLVWWEVVGRGNLEMIQFLSSSPDLEEHCDIHMDNDYALRYACYRGYLPIVEFFTSSPELKTHSNIRINDDEPLMKAVENGHYNIVKFLLTSPKLKEHSNLYARENTAFKMACRLDDISIAQFFIFEMNIEKTQEIENFIKKFNYQEVQKLFEKRESYYQLSQKITEKEDKNNMSKIKI